LKKTVDLKLLIAYFFIGGAVVAAATYFGSRGNSLLAVFIAFFPGMTVIIMSTIYFAGGQAATISYAKGMLVLLPAWILYVLGVIFLLPRLGLALSLVISVVVYTAAAFLTMRLA
jgi:hypothetical protein